MPYSSTSGADVVTHLTGRTGNNTNFWSSQERRDSFNEALSVWNGMTGEFTTSFSLPAVPGQIFYEVPKQIASVQRISHNGLALTPTSLDDLDMGSPGWQNDSSATPLRWITIGLTTVALNPPASSGSLLFEGIAETPHLLNDGDSMDIGDEYLDPLLGYGHHYLSFKDGGAEFQATMAGIQKFAEAVGGRNSRFIAVTNMMRMMGKDSSEVLKKPKSQIKSIGAKG